MARSDPILYAEKNITPTISFNESFIIELRQFTHYASSGKYI